MHREFILAEASFPKKLLIYLCLIFIILFLGYLNDHYNFISDLNPKYEGVIYVCLFILLLFIFFKVFITDNYKPIGKISFHSDQIKVHLKNDLLYYNLSEIERLRFLYTGIFGDFYTMKGLGSLYTKDGSGNYFIFNYKSKDHIFNIVLEDYKDFKVINNIFDMYKNKFGKNVEYIDKIETKNRFYIFKQ